MTSKAIIHRLNKQHIIICTAIEKKQKHNKLVKRGEKNNIYWTTITIKTIT